MLKRIVTHLEEESSFEHWWPAVVKLGIPAPKTTIVPLTPKEIKIMNEERVPHSVVDKVATAALAYGYPFFLRTDLASGKHQWKSSCFVSDPEKLGSNIVGVISSNLTADIFGLPFRSLVVREYIPLEARFTAFWGEMPVAKERRYFVRGGQVLCRHEYWVEGAIRQGMSTSKMPESEWLPMLQELNRQDHYEAIDLSRHASRIGRALGGYWSVDFAKTADGRWLLIDMGRGELSYHKEGCESAIAPNLCDLCGERMSGDMYKKHGGRCRRCRTNLADLADGLVKTP